MNSIPIQLIYPDPFTDELVNANVCGPRPLPDDGLTDTFTGGCAAAPTVQIPICVQPTA